MELYIRPRTSETDDRRSGTLATGRVRLTLVRAGEKGGALWTKELEAEGVTLFVDELPSGKRAAATKGKRAPHDVSSPERAVGPVPELHGFTRRQLEGRPGLARGSRAAGAAPGDSAELPEPQQPARARTRAAKPVRRATRRRG